MFVFGVSMDKRRIGWGLVALAASLVLHLCVLSWMPTAGTAQQRSSSGKLIWLEAPPSAPSTTKWMTPPPPPPRAEPRRRDRPVEETPPEPDDPARETDSPRVAVLTPRAPDSLQALSPAALSGQDERAAPEQQRVSSIVGTWLLSDVSSARARGGRLDPTSGQLGSALRAATRDVPRFIDTNSPTAVGGALLKSWSPAAERYGKTGAPYTEPEGRLATIERPSELAKLVAKGDEHAQAMAQFLSAGARLQEFADGRAGVGLYAVVEVRELSSGASVQLIRASGLAPFDAWVLERARQVALTFSVDGGQRTRPLRSVWRFDGVIRFRRKLKLSELDGGVRAAVGLVTMAALSALSSVKHETRDPDAPGRPLGPRMPGMVGRFDETTGALDVVDLTNPTYDCTVQLLEAD